MDFSANCDVWLGIAQVASGGGSPVENDIQVMDLNSHRGADYGDYIGSTGTDILCAAGDAIYLMIYHNEAMFTPPGTMTSKDHRETQLSVSEIV